MGIEVLLSEFSRIKCKIKQERVKTIADNRLVTQSGAVIKSYIATSHEVWTRWEMSCPGYGLRRGGTAARYPKPDNLEDCGEICDVA